LSARGRIRGLVNRVLGLAGYEAIPRCFVYDWQRMTRPDPGRVELPEGARDWLRDDNPRLEELRRRYALCDPAVTTPLIWKRGYVEPTQVTLFRGDSPYVWELRGPNMHETAYALAAYYARTIDRLGLFDRLEEDGLFGCHTFRFGDLVVSRDLLDSVAEIYFLERHLGLSSARNLTVLDIGAGYGRLAHRLVTALPNIGSYLCADAVPVSTFICEYYLKFRGLADRARAVPLDELAEALDRQPPDLAINVHSFSECTLEAIDWWLALIEQHRVRHLMVVPNPGDHRGTRLLTNDGRDFGPVIERHGYRLAAKDPKYLDPGVQQYAINPTHHYLFEFRGPAPKEASE